MKPQDVASSQECVDGHTKIQAKSQAKSRAKSPTCVSQVTWGPVTLVPHKGTNNIDSVPHEDLTKLYDPQESLQIPKGSHKSDVPKGSHKIKRENEPL
jgi:hypothetical protein